MWPRWPAAPCGVFSVAIDEPSTSSSILSLSRVHVAVSAVVLTGSFNSDCDSLVHARCLQRRPAALNVAVVGVLSLSLLPEAAVHKQKKENPLSEDVAGLRLDHVLSG